MRCIEIRPFRENVGLVTKINRNMRCIEMGLRQKKKNNRNKINRNMRCIEIWQVTRMKEGQQLD